MTCRTRQAPTARVHSLLCQHIFDYAIQLIALHTHRSQLDAAHNPCLPINRTGPRGGPCVQTVQMRRPCILRYALQGRSLLRESLRTHVRDAAPEPTDDSIVEYARLFALAP